MFPLLHRIFRWSHLLLIACLLPGGALHAQSSDSVKVIAAVKFPPIKTLSNELMGLTRKIMPGQQTEMYPLMLLGAFGYPNYPGVSETEGPTIFFFRADKGEPTPYVILSKMSQDAPMRKALTMKSKGGDSMFGFLAPGLVTVERDGWTLFSNESASFEYAKDVKALAQLATGIDGFDITARIYIGPEIMAEWVEQMKTSIAEEYLLNGGKESDPVLLHKQLYIDFLATIGCNLEWMSTGLNINQNDVALGFSIQAIEGSPEYKFLSAQAGGPAPIADYVERSTLSFITKLDHLSFLNYYNTLDDRALKLATVDGQKWLERAGVINRAYLQEVGDAGAGSMTFLEEKIVTMNALSGQLNNELVMKTLRFYYEELIPYYQQHYSDMGMWQSEVEMVLKEDIAQVQNSPISLVESKVTVTPMLQVNPTTDAGEDVTTQETFFSVINGNLVSSSHLETLVSLANNLAESKPADNSVASMITLEAGQAFGFELDVRSLVGILTQEFVPESEISRQSLKDLTSSDLAPVTGGVRLGKGLGIFEITVPVDTIVKFAETQRQIKQSEMEMQTFGGERPKPTLKTPAE